MLLPYFILQRWFHSLCLILFQIDIDFATKYPEARNALFDNWDNFTDKILNFAQNKFNSDLKFQLIITDAALDVFVEGVY